MSIPTVRTPAPSVNTALAPVKPVPTLADRPAQAERNLAYVAGWAGHKLDGAELDSLSTARRILIEVREGIGTRRGFGVPVRLNDTIAADPWPDLEAELIAAGIPDDLHLTLVEDR